MPVDRFEEVTIEQIVQAVDEACSNVIEHSYGMMAGNEFSMTMNSDKEKVTFLIEDSGIGLEGVKAQKPDIKEYVEQRKDGGWGRYIIAHVMDEVEYARTGKKNKLTLVKYFNGMRKEEGA
jgi:serine/threonine-protein kinase RsbW